jgi:GNAT superfamily N-acetyltransferase
MSKGDYMPPDIKRVYNKTHTTFYEGYASATFIGPTVFINAVVEASLIGDIWWISRAFSHKDLRGKGVGSKLLQLVIKEIKKQGGRYIYVTPGGYDGKKRKQFNFYIKGGFRRATKEEIPDSSERRSLLIFKL